MSAALSIAAAQPIYARPLQPEVTGFKAYLTRSLYDPFIINLKDATLMQVIEACVKAKSKLHRGYRESLGSLIHNLQAIEAAYGITLLPVQVTDVFWGYFIAFCQGRGLKASTINTLCNQLRSVLNWSVKHNATVSPTYTDFRVPMVHNQEIALTANEVSRIIYFDIDMFYAGRRKDYIERMKRIRDMFVLSVSLGQRHSDMVRIDATCFERNIFRITQQKTGNLAVVDIDKFAVDPGTVYDILERYDYKAPYPASIGNYNYALHDLMRDIGFTEPVRLEERVAGKLVVSNTPKWKLITSHTARRTFTTVNVMRGYNIHAIKKATGHTDLRSLDKYVCDD